MVKKFKIVDRRLVETDDESSPFVAYVNPDDREKRFLVDNLKIDEHTLQSSLDPDELSRLEFEPDHFAVIFKRPRNYSAQDQFLFKVASTGLFLFKDRLVIVIGEDVPLFDSLIFNKPATPAYLMLRMISRSIFHYFEHLKIINTISDELQNKINRAMENRHLLNLFTLEKSLEYYRREGLEGERLGDLLERLGIEKYREEVLP